MVDIQYFSVLQPPLPLPVWLYSQIVAGRYEALFERIIEQIRQVSEAAQLKPGGLDRVGTG
jgi:hypothetical protein